ncbi:hypothetical protein F4679DRAFT_432115 [Xylaria curta]|nr:hypothetical protein F4679DRAFT_432115 [Xylaria curta]
MLLRQLYRPLLRSVAAAWRPAITSPQYGDSRSNSGASNSDDHQHETSSSLGPKPSLFEQLFPDEAKKSRAKIKRASNADAPNNTWVSQLFAEDDEPPRLAVPEELQDEGDVTAQETSELWSPALRAKGMLILGAASKSLVESDFLRLGMKGKHVEGWVGGIIKVIQARDPDTLEPKGHYFILFDTHEAAVAYKDRLEHLWGLGKAYIPGAHHGRWHAMQQPLYKGLRRNRADEDTGRLVRSFTLVPPSQRLNVQLSRASPERIAELYLEGGFVNRLAARAGSDFLVLIRIDGGRLTLDTLRRAIDDDGARRNLAWRITDLDNGILPFGKSFLRANDQAQAQAQAQAQLDSTDAEVSSQDLQDEDTDHNGGENGNNSGKSTVNAIYEAKGDSERHRQYPRFIIPFMDEAEAYRFVQNWHRRELRLQMGGGGKDQPSWEETRTINATVLW